MVDLGVWWQERTGLPLPLGGNVVRRDLGQETIRQISRLLKESIQYGLDHRDDALAYALRYARDMDKSLADRFVSMYVNDWTLDYGPRGREADLAIAACALAHGAHLWVLNRNDFQDIRDLRLL